MSRVRDTPRSRPRRGVNLLDEGLCDVAIRTRGVARYGVGRLSSEKPGSHYSILAAFYSRAGRIHSGHAEPIAPAIAADKWEI